MKELLELLDVVASGSADSCVVLGNCSVYDAVLSGYCVICREYNVPAVEDWIRNNIRSSVDHCIKMFNKKPEAIMKFIVASQNAKSLTEEFVKGCGGLQGFLDKYAKVPEPESEAAVPEGPKEITAFGGDAPKVEDAADSTDGADDTVSEEGLAAVDAVPAEEIPAASAVKPGSSEALAEALKVTKDMWDVGSASPAEVSSEVQAEKSVQEEAVTEMPALERPLTADEQLQQMLEQQRRVDAEKNGLVPEEPEVKEPESKLVPEAGNPEPVQKGLDVGKRKELADSLFNEEGEFAGFTEDQTIAVMKMLKTIDPAINLDGLEPGNILSKEEMEESKGIIESFAPGVFKSFVLYEMEKASTDYELIRTTVMLDDFCNFVNKEYGGR